MLYNIKCTEDSTKLKGGGKVINERLLEKLKVVTKEERKLLDGEIDIERNIYMQSSLNVINSQKLLEKGKLITIRPHTRFVRFPEHSHDFVEMVYMCSGSTTHMVNGKKVNLKEGELLILCQSAVQEILPAGFDDIAVNFIVLPSFFDDVLRIIEEENTPLRKFLIDTIKGNNSETPYLHFKVSEVLPIQNLIENLIWNLLHKVTNKRNINQRTMALLLLQLINHSDKLDAYEQDETIMKVLRYIEDNYKEGSLSELSENLYCDLYSLSREIKRKTGKNYTELLQEKRLSQACFYLKNSKMTVEDIAFSVGYENISYFYHIFKNTYGLSPRKYRVKE